MMKSIFAGVVLTLAAAPSYAQVVEELPGSGDSPTTELAEEGEVESPSVRWTFKFAPTFAGDLPSDSGTRLTDFQTTSAAVAFAVPLAPNAQSLGAVFEVDFGLRADTDFDQDSSDDAGSAAFFNSKVTHRRGFRRLNPYAGYGVERGWEDFLDNRTYTDHKLSAGVRFDSFRSVRCRPGEEASQGRCTGPTGFEATLIASVERTFSSEGDRERWTPRLAVELSGQLVSRTRWRLTGTGEVRIFDEFAGQNRVDWVANTFAGIDLAEQISPGRRFLREFALGVRLLTRESNTATDYVRFNILPVISVSQAF
jgi:hypothetical protein